MLLMIGWHHGDVDDADGTDDIDGDDLVVGIICGSTRLYFWQWQFHHMPALRLATNINVVSAALSMGLSTQPRIRSAETHVSPGQERSIEPLQSRASHTPALIPHNSVGVR